MAPVSEGGGKAGIVLSASPLFTGDAGRACSNIRRWLFEQDYIDCIVKLPVSIFFRTGINTYLWILSNNKPAERKGLVQLIDASEMKTPLRKNLGNKRYEISDEDREWIVKTYIDGHDHGNSVIVPVEEFMYRKVTTQRPLRAVVRITEDKIEDLLAVKALSKLSDANKDILRQHLMSKLADGKTETDLAYETVESIIKPARSAMTKPEATAAAMAKAVRDVMTVKGSKFPLVHDKNGNIMADPDLKDTENIPFDMSFDTYMEKEVLPYAPETWIDETVRDEGPLQDGKVGVVGTNISFNKYFYHYEEPRKPEVIAKEIMELESGLEEFMKEFL